MLGKRFHLGYAWLFISLGSTALVLATYFAYLETSAYNDIRFLDVFALIFMVVALSYLLTCLLDDISYALSSKKNIVIKVIDKKHFFRMFGGRGISKVTYSYRISYEDGESQKLGVLVCSKNHYDILEIGERVICTIKGNILQDLNLH